MINRVIEFAMNKQIFGTENNCSLSKCPFDFLAPIQPEGSLNKQMSGAYLPAAVKS